MVKLYSHSNSKPSRFISSVPNISTSTRKSIRRYWCFRLNYILSFALISLVVIWISTFLYVLRDVSRDQYHYHQNINSDAKIIRSNGNYSQPILIQFFEKNQSSSTLSSPKNTNKTFNIDLVSQQLPVNTHSKDASNQVYYEHKSDISHQIVSEIPLIIFTCQRAEYLKRTLEAILKYHPLQRNENNIYINNHNNTRGYPIVGSPIIISQDGTDPQVHSMIQTFIPLFESIHLPLYHITHQRTNSFKLRGAAAYQALSRHYGSSLRLIFSGEAYSKYNNITSYPLLNQQLPPLPKMVIILEEDIEISIDFFSYMNATSVLLDNDLDLLAVSAYNDNGKKQLVKDERRLLRSDFFPGLGWMMHRRIWNELDIIWPNAYWDDWIREPAQRKGRHIIRPEISRTFHFGQVGGASENQYSNHLDDILLNSVDVDWMNEDIHYLEKDTFRDYYLKQVSSATFVNIPKKGNNYDLSDAMKQIQIGNVRVQYANWDHFVQLARRFNIMDNEKAGIPRTAYEGIVEFRPTNTNLLFLTPLHLKF